MRFWRDGLGLTELFDYTFTGDWPTLFGAATDQLRSIFLGDPETPETGIVELVVLERTRERTESAEPTPTMFRRSASSCCRCSAMSTRRLVTLAGLGFDDGVRRIEMPAPGGKTVAMAVITAPDGVRVELIGPPQ